MTKNTINTSKIITFVFATFLCSQISLFASETTTPIKDNSTAKTEANKNDNAPGSSKYSLSLDGLYANSLRKAEKGGVNMTGLDFRLNAKINESSSWSIGVLTMTGSESIGTNLDLETSNFAFLVGWQAIFPFSDNHIQLFVGPRIGLASVTYTLDEGRTDGWDHYSQDSDLCAAYAAEAGASFLINEQWRLRASYEFYGNTAKIGGSIREFDEQHYHTFKIGAEYRF